MSTVKVVRLYFKEAEKTRDHHNLLRELFHLLRNEHDIRGATVFRGTAGFGSHGVESADDLLRFNVHLPLVLEIFDAPDKINRLLPALKKLVEPNHILCFEASIADDPTD